MRRREFVTFVCGTAMSWPAGARGQQLGAAIGWPLVARGQLAEVERLSKAQAQYQDNPRGIAMCATCTLFVAPRACKVVDGDISPNGWCKEYAMAD